MAGLLGFFEELGNVLLSSGKRDIRKCGGGCKIMPNTMWTEGRLEQETESQKSSSLTSISTSNLKIAA